VAAQGYHNHMIIYLPEFKLFDDPTAGYAAFGVLAQGDYDKPVVRMSARGGVHLDRTPAMRAEDHASINRTRISVAADGTMTGETLETGTGMFAMGLRETVATIQHNGAEKSAENFLRMSGAPGKGRFEIGSPSDLAEPYALKSAFKLDGKMSTAPGAEQSLPFGLMTRVRPGGYLFNRRFEGRKLPFVCYAGRQVEEIDVTFADGIPFPVALPTKGRKIEDRAFTFTSDYRIENRTLKIRREFVSRVSGQVCAPETETAVAGAMSAVQADLNTRIRFPSTQVAANKDPAPAQRVDAPSQPKPVRPVEVVAASKPEQRVDPAPTDTAANRSWCGGAQEASADLRIHACTAIIQSGQETPLSLAVAFANRGHAYRMKGEHGRAIPDFDQAIRLVPNYAAGFNGRGMAWHLARNFDRAIADFNEAIRLNPTFAAAFVNRGNVYRDTSAAELAMRDFDQAIELDPALAFAWLSRGRALRAAGQHDRAIADFDQAIRLQRSNVVAWNELCYAQTLGGRTAAALESCDQALKLRPNDRFALDYRGLALLKLDELDRAIANWDAALQLYPKEAHALYGRGMAKVRKGDVDGGNADIAAATAARPQIVQEFARLGLPATDTRVERTSASTADVARQMVKPD
ncbi:MAG: tetratricopeptide repeat protein, partial [Xanthobacteraceae bacterium]